MQKINKITIHVFISLTMVTICLPKNQIWTMDPGSWGGGGLPCERGGDAYPEIGIKPLRETNLRVAQAFLTLNTGYQ